MVVGMVGVLKAGGAYVPLDAQYPVERLEYMVGDAGVEVLLTQQRLISRFYKLPVERNIQLINLDQDRAEIGWQSADNLEHGISEDNLVYVIYTSGSTGKPKGAMVSHKGVVNCIRWMQETYSLDETDGFLQKTVLNFDPSVWEIFWPLWVGARVILAKPGGHLDSAYLIETIKQHQVTSVYFVPTMLRAFLEEAKPHSLPSLRRVICGGESLPKELLDQYFLQLTAEFHHSYGPTETSIAVTEWTCSALSGSSIAPIGRPLGNTQIYLLDAALQPVPVGVAGELYIGGEGVGRGYLHRPELTAERFIPDPFSRKSGQRLYRTGDLARYLPDGNIEFLGRVDQQVKLRGYRIELGEIDAALLEHQAVNDCIAVICTQSSGEQMLVAYIVPEEKDAFPVSDVRRHLKEQLPEYMVPKVLMTIDKLPLNVNGKVDRRQLPSPEKSQPETAASYVEPRNPVEDVLAGIWNETLGMERIGVYDNFFDLGGHSLLITKVISRIHALLSVTLPITSLFQSPTIAELAQMLVEQEATPGQVNAIAALRVKIDRLSPEEIQAMLLQKKALA
jgi:amino acid adenylation domain-containing protein